jgi:2-amino-4-hydroxy-6-hydroxymethyldihydropteridine diphosphokinase
MLAKHNVFLGLGSNVGDRAANLAAALSGLPSEVAVLQRSPIYETPPWGYEEQGAFLNQVVQVETDLGPLELLALLKLIEADAGRTTTFRYGPREIDIDILLYADLVFEHETLTIPHPSLHERAFMLVPLADLAPGLMHPTLKQTIAALRDALDTSEIKPYKPGRKK